jgi:hypothetical protein
MKIVIRGNSVQIFAGHTYNNRILYINLSERIKMVQSTNQFEKLKKKLLASNLFNKLLKINRIVNS